MMASRMPAAHHVVEKTMSLSLSEFQASLGKLLGTEIEAEEPSVRHPLAKGCVEIRFVPLPSLRLGGLLELPRAKVSLSFDDVEDDDRAAFLARFDLAFQRGGG